MKQCNGYTLDIVKLTKGWAIKATVNGESRYRPFYYKLEAQSNLGEWTDYRSAGDFMRDFHHNFHSLVELNMKEK